MASQIRKRKILMKPEEDDGADGADQLEHAFACLFVFLVKERFHGEKENVFQEFRVLMDKYRNEEIGTDALIPMVKTLFAGEDYLVSEFKNFMALDDIQDNNQKSSSTDPSSDNQGRSSRSKRRSSSPDSKDEPVLQAAKKPRHDPEEVKGKLKESVDFLNKLRQILGEDDKYETFLNLVIGFYKEHKDVERFLKESFPLLGESPELETGISYFTLETIKMNHPSISSCGGDDLGDGRKKPTSKENLGDPLSNWEEDMYDSDMWRLDMESCKESIERLVGDNSCENPDEEIDVSLYFWPVVLKRLTREILKEEKSFLMERMWPRGLAVRKAKNIASFLEKKLQDQWEKDRARVEQMKASNQDKYQPKAISGKQYLPSNSNF